MSARVITGRLRGKGQRRDKLRVTRSVSADVDYQLAKDSVRKTTDTYKRLKALTTQYVQRLGEVAEVSRRLGEELQEYGSDPTHRAMENSDLARVLMQAGRLLELVGSSEGLVVWGQVFGAYLDRFSEVHLGPVGADIPAVDRIRADWEATAAKVTKLRRKEAGATSGCEEEGDPAKVAAAVVREQQQREALALAARDFGWRVDAMRRTEADELRGTLKMAVTEMGGFFGRGVQLCEQVGEEEEEEGCMFEQRPTDLRSVDWLDLLDDAQLLKDLKKSDSHVVAKYPAISVTPCMLPQSEMRYLVLLRDSDSAVEASPLYTRSGDPLDDPLPALAPSQQRTGRQLQHVVIRGTDFLKLKHILLDLDTRMEHDDLLGIDVHRGFRQAALEMYKVVRGQLDPQLPVKITGHSLGAAVGQLLGLYLKHDGYTITAINVFGAPRYTNEEGARVLEGQLPEVLRVANYHDVVRTLPPGMYHHFGPSLLLFDDGTVWALQKAPDVEPSKFVSHSVSFSQHRTAHYHSRLQAQVERQLGVVFASRDQLGQPSPTPLQMPEPDSPTTLKPQWAPWRSKTPSADSLPNPASSRTSPTLRVTFQGAPSPPRTQRPAQQPTPTATSAHPSPAAAAGLPPLAEGAPRLAHKATSDPTLHTVAVDVLPRRRDAMAADDLLLLHTGKIRLLPHGTDDSSKAPPLVVFSTTTATEQRPRPVTMGSLRLLRARHSDT